MQMTSTELMSQLQPASILLVPEMAISPLQDDLKDYDQMLQALADEHESLWYFQPLADRSSSDQHLADRNHLTREGNRWLGEQLGSFIREKSLLSE